MTKEKIKLKFTKISPGGNMTILIWNKVDRKKYSKIANILMDNIYNLGAEQVGYVEKSKNKKAIAHLQMMGGEFCGNATRSLAYMLVRKKTKGIEIKNNIASFFLTVSGVKKPLKVEVSCDKKNNPISAKIEMPIYNNPEAIYKKNDLNIVLLEGISHIIVDEKDKKFNEKSYKKDFLKIKKESELKNKEAISVIWKKENQDRSILIKPVIWVKETNSYYYETSCASGTIATALLLAKNNNQEKQKNKIYQPSKKYISTEVQKKNNLFTKAYIEGEVDVIAEGICYVNY